MKNIKVVLAVIMSSVAVGCGGGGGGGGGGTSPTLSAFTSFSNIKPGDRVVLSGDSQEVDYTATISGNSSKVDSLNNFKAHDSGAEVIVGYNSSGYLNYVKLTTAEGTNLEFTEQNGSKVFEFGEILEVSNASGTDYIITIDPSELPSEFQFDYQSFGIWTTGGGTGSGKTGVYSVGNPTAVSNMPLSGTANYAGLSFGRYVDGTGKSFFSEGTVSVNADFSAQTVGFATNYGATSLMNEISEVFSSGAFLSMNGTLSISSGTSTFSGPVTTSSGLSGTASGRFYGPSANEVGGTFNLTGNSIETHSGGFGAVRQ